MNSPLQEYPQIGNLLLAESLVLSSKCHLSRTYYNFYGIERQLKMNISKLAVLKYAGLDQSLGGILLAGTLLSLLASWGVEMLVQTIFSYS
jgi:hypothetical protein